MLPSCRTLDGEDHEVTPVIAPDGRLERVTMRRWGDPGGHPFREHRLGMECLEEGTFDGFTSPARVRGGWWPGTRVRRRAVRW
ncbi:hypothetical protein [Nonomuraea sp. KM90]|uniref:hypothetical protein n=1 Tax=Nonomuraea sp. KM90 TaxID=3457428 RepID=UPI003FCE7F4F